MSQYFYSGEIRRFIAQFIRAMSGFTVNFGRDANGNVQFRTVPCTYGDPSRQAASIQRANSANTAITAPQISCYVAGMKYARERVQEPNFVKKVNVIERKIDPITGLYTNLPGNKFTVERLMPVPYDLTMKADIWTTSTDQKLQLIEQMLILFNPSLEIQSTDNFLSWGSMSYIELTQTNWTSRQIPVGAEEPIDIFTLTFQMPIWISAPAKVKKLGVITNIIVDLFDANGGLREDLASLGFTADDFLMDANLRDSGTSMTAFATPVSNSGDWTRQKPERTSPTTTEVVQTLVERPMGVRVSFPYDVIVLNGVASLVQQRQGTIADDPNGPVMPAHNLYMPWDAVLAQIDGFQDGVARLYLRQTDEVEVVGVVSTNPTDPTKLLFAVDLDTIPSNTLAAVDRIIDPLLQGPGHGLPAAHIGQRYLLLNDTGNIVNAPGAAAWTTNGEDYLVALKYDIVQYNGTKWVVSFRAAGTTANNYVTNLANGQQFKWNGIEWLRSWEGLYREGEWRLD